MNSLSLLPNTQRKHRMFLTIFALLAFFLITYQSGSVSREQSLDELETRSSSDLNRYVFSLQQTLKRYEDLPNLVASHSHLQAVLRAPYRNDLVLQANEYLEHVALTMNATDVYVMDLSGNTLAASNWRLERSFVGKNYSYRPYFQDAIAGYNGRYFALGSVSKKRGYYFSYPVRVNGKIIGATVVKIDLNDIEDDWSDAEQHILVSDEDGVVFISTRKEWKFRTLAKMSAKDMSRIIASKRYGDQPLREIDIVEQEQRSDAANLVTVMEVKTHMNAALDGVEPHKYLIQSRELSNYGLNVSIMASTSNVSKQVLNAVILTSFAYVALLMLLMFVVARHRIKGERERFERERTQALEENERRIRAIFNNTQAGLITLDSKGRMESTNPTARRLFAYTDAALQGQFFSLLVSQEDRRRCWQHITSPLSQGVGELMMEATGIRSSGESFPVELIIGQMSDDGDQRFIVTIHDITERKIYEDRLQRARDLLESRVEERTVDLTLANQQLVEEVESHESTRNELIQTAKLAVLGQMSAGINHELNQPLTAIRAYADNARAFLARSQGDMAVMNLEEISSLTERMAKIIHPLKEFSRNTSGQPAPVCLEAVREGAMSIMYGRLDKEYVDIQWPDNLERVYVLADIVRLEQVIVNLLTNGLQAMETCETKRLEISLERSPGRVQLSVRDLGTGIPETDIDRVFEPFYTTKNAGQGLGLGLSISHRIISSLNGKLWVENHPEQGAVFYIDLPSAEVLHTLNESVDPHHDEF